jgi:hypothetical protein
MQPDEIFQHRLLVVQRTSTEFHDKQFLFQCCHDLMRFNSVVLSHEIGSFIVSAA